VHWLYDIDIPHDELLIFMGEFNFIRSQNNRSMCGRDVNDMFLFNDNVDHLGKEDLSLGQICSKTLLWGSLSGSSLVPTRFLSIQKLMFTL
jgi:hypothetical protein